MHQKKERKKHEFICLKIKVIKANTVARKADCGHQQFLHLPPLSILSTLHKQQNSNFSYDKEVQQKEWEEQGVDEQYKKKYP